MLASSETVDIVADTLIAQNISTIVLDPVSACERHEGYILTLGQGSNCI